MKKLILLLAFVVFSVPAFAQNQETLLTPDGTLFTIQQVLASDHPEVESQAWAFLQLSARRGDEVITAPVPGSLASGSHNVPALAYDSASKRLFVFWVRQVTLMHSELQFASVDENGVWTEATSFGGPFDYRENLRVAVTRRVSDAEGAVDAEPAISVHATWWEFDTHTGNESAQYAMLSIDDGQVTSVAELNLSDFVDRTLPPSVDETEGRVLKQPLLFSSSKQDSVVVLFGDLYARRFTEVRIRPTKPVADGRLRVPVGRREGGFASPKLDSAPDGQQGRVEGIYAEKGHLALYTLGDHRLRYAVMHEGNWSEQRVIVLDEQVSAGQAIDALRRLLHEN